MIKREALIILYLVGAVMIEEAHQLFSGYPVERIRMFPFDHTKISIQWYVHDLSNCISAVLISLAVYTAFITRNMRNIALAYLGYRVFELFYFVLWNKQLGYVQLLLLFGLVLFIIITKWKNKLSSGI